MPRRGLPAIRPDFAVSLFEAWCQVVFMGFHLVFSDFLGDLYSFFHIQTEIRVSFGSFRGAFSGLWNGGVLMFLVSLLINLL
jgi:hypothetical protein